MNSYSGLSVGQLRRTLLLLLTLGTSALAQTPAAANPASAPRVGELITLSPFEVQGASGYTAPVTSSGTRVRADLRELPFAVGVVTSEFLTDFVAFNDYKDSLAFTSGVATRGNYNQAYYIRGLQNDGQLRNGFFRAGMFDTINVDRIEVIKGPNASIYGRSSPGGAINVVTKMPTPFWEVQATARVSSEDMTRFELSVSGPLDSGKRLLFRLDAAKQNEEFFYDREDYQQETVSGVLQYRFGGGGNLTLEADWLDKLQEAPEARTLFRRVGGVITSQLATELGGFSPNPGQSYLNRELKAGNLTFEQALSEHVRFRATAHASQRMDPSWRTGGDTFYTVETRTIANRLADLQLGGTKYLAFQSDLLFDFKLGPTEQKLLAVFDFGRDTGRDERWRVATADRNNPAFNIATLSVDAPNYFMPDRSQLRDFYRNDTARTETKAVFVSDRIYFAEKRGLLLVGARQDWVQSTSLNYFNGAGTDEKRDATTYQVGGNWKLAEPVSLYANHSTSFRVNGQINPATGTPFDNQKGRGWEGGIKSELFGKRLTLTAAYFDVTRHNVVRTNPVTRLQELTGRENSHGVELDFHYNVADGWLVFGQYTRLKARITADVQDPTLVGFQLPFVPDTTWGIATRYQLQRGPLNGLYFTLGLKFVDQITTSTSNAPYQRNYRQPSYTQLDGGLGYRWKAGHQFRHRVALNITDLTDEAAFFGDRVISKGFTATFSYTASFR
jgi:iron complex outermembrane receptor protein